MTFSKNNPLSKYTWGDNCTGWNFVETPELSVKQELMPPGTAEKLHHHERARQFFFILRGEATFEIDGVTHLVRANEGIEIAPGAIHRVLNKGAGDLEFLLSSQPSTKGDRIEKQD